MRKLLIGLVLALALTGMALAETADVVVIGGEEEAAASMEDLKLGDTVSIEDYADISLTEAELEYDDGNLSGYLYLTGTFLNRQKTAVDFYETFNYENARARFDEDYEYPAYTIDITEGYSTVEPLYSSVFCIRIELPKYVIEAEEPLCVEFTVGEYEFTYFYRS